MAGEYVEICNMPDVKNCYGEKQKQGKRNGAVHQKKKRQRVDLINKIRNKRSYNQYHRNTNNHNRILRIIIQQQIGSPRGNG